MSLLRKIVGCCVAAGCAVGPVSCSSDSDSGIPEYITIDASISGGGAQTRATTTGLRMTFDPGDRLTVYAWSSRTNLTVSAADAVTKGEVVVDGAVNTLGQDGRWTSSPQMLWADMTSRHYFLGIYPERRVTDFMADPYRLSGDYEADDLLAGTNLQGLTPTGDPVGIVFDHLMAKLVVNMNFRDQWGGTPDDVSVECLAADACTVDYTRLACTPGGQTTVSLAATEPSQGFSKTAMGIMVPQEGFNTITVVVGGRRFTYVHPEDIPLQQGNITTVNFVVGRDSLELRVVTINGWESEVVLDAEAELQN